MAYTATKLITNSWYSSGIVSRQLDTVDGEQLTDGLDLLNSLLSFISVSGRLVPYYQTYSLTAVIGQERYFIENLIDIDAYTFNIGSVRFPTTERSRREYFGTGRANNIRSLPVSWHLERTKGGAYLYLYFLPNTTYPLNFIGKFGATEVELGDDLSEIYDRYYLDYLEYALAERLCAFYNMAMPARAQELLEEYTQTIRDLSPLDLRMKKLSTLQTGTTFNYADANIGRGWRP